MRPVTLADQLETLLLASDMHAELSGVKGTVLRNAFYAGALGVMRFSTDNFRASLDGDRFTALVEEAMSFIESGTRGDAAAPATLAREVAEFIRGDGPLLGPLREKIFYSGAASVVELVTDVAGMLDQTRLNNLIRELVAYVFKAAGGGG